MKKIFIVAVIIIIAGFAVIPVTDLAVKTVITIVATQITGSPVHIDGLSLGLFSRSIRITGFKMYNPQGFSRDILIDLEKIYVAADLGELLKGRLHIINAEIELRQMGLEKDKEGRLNVDSLRVVQQADTRGGKPPKQMPMRLDTLQLGIGKIVYKDYSFGTGPTIRVYDVNIHKKYKNISSAQQLAALILAEPMKSAGIQGAKIYGLALLSGAAVLPVAVAMTFAGSDSVEQNIKSSFDDLYNRSLEVLKAKGKVTREDKTGGVISGSVNSVQITVRVRRKSQVLTQITVSARKYLFPKPEIAGGILYEISEKIK